MQAIKKNITRFIVLLLAVQIINLSIQARPVNEVMLENSAKEVNRIDDAVEYLLEVVMNQKDAIPEGNKQNQHYPIHSNKAEIFKAFVTTCYYSYNAEEALTSISRISFTVNCIYQFCKEINPPPPKFC